MPGVPISGAPQAMTPNMGMNNPMPGAGPPMAGGPMRQGMGGQAILDQIAQLPQTNSLTFLQQLIQQAMLGGQATAPQPMRPGMAGAPTAAPANATTARGYQGAANQLSMGQQPRMVGSSWVSPWLRGLQG